MVNKNSKRETWSFKPLIRLTYRGCHANGSFADMAANAHTE